MSVRALSRAGSRYCFHAGPHHLRSLCVARVPAPATRSILFSGLGFHSKWNPYGSFHLPTLLLLGNEPFTFLLDKSLLGWFMTLPLLYIYITIFICIILYIYILLSIYITIYIYYCIYYYIYTYISIYILLLILRIYIYYYIYITIYIYYNIYITIYIAIYI